MIPGLLFTVTISGHPATKGSKKHVGGGRMAEMDKKLPAWDRAVLRACTAVKPPGFAPLDGALAVKADWYLPRPAKSKFGEHPAGPPDLDKLQRALGDGLTAAGVLADDARVVCWYDPTKHWAPVGEPGFVGAVVSVYRYEGPRP